MVTEKLTLLPSQPLAVGVTVMVPMIGIPLLLAGAFQGAMFPEPEAANPMAGFVFDQL